MPELEREPSLLRELFHECFEQFEINLKVRRQLNQYRTKFFFQSRRAVEKVVHFIVNILEPFEMSDALAQLKRERKILRHFIVPVFTELRGGHSVKSVVDLRRAEVFGVIRQIFFSRKFFRVEASLPFLVSEARCSN